MPLFAIAEHIANGLRAETRVGMPGSAPRVWLGINQEGNWADFPGTRGNVSPTITVCLEDMVVVTEDGCEHLSSVSRKTW